MRKYTSVIKTRYQGNSLICSIPKEIVELLNIKKGDFLSCDFEKLKEEIMPFWILGSLTSNFLLILTNMEKYFLIKKNGS